MARPKEHRQHVRRTDIPPTEEQWNIVVGSLPLRREEEVFPVKQVLSPMESNQNYAKASIKYGWDDAEDDRMRNSRFSSLREMTQIIDENRQEIIRLDQELFGMPSNER